MECPKCHLVNPSGALQCDCGYNFATGKIVSRPRSSPHDWGALKWVAFLVALVAWWVAVAGVKHPLNPSPIERVRDIFIPSSLEFYLVYFALKQPMPMLMRIVCVGFAGLLMGVITLVIVVLQLGVTEGDHVSYAAVATFAGELFAIAAWWYISTRRKRIPPKRPQSV